MVSAISDAQNSSDHREEEQNVSSEDAILTELRNIRKELEFLKNDNAELKKRLDEK